MTSIVEFLISMFYLIKVLLFSYFLFIGTLIAENVKNIKIIGNQRIDDDTILTYLNIKKNQLIKEEDLNSLFKDLFSTELFSEIIFKLKTNTLIIEVKENPIVNRVALEGNRHLKDDELLPEIYIKPRDVFTKNKVKENLQRILSLYRSSGRYAAIIEPKIIYLEQNRVDVVFEINEGPASKIQSIKFLGNQFFSDRKLKSEVMVSESRWWKILSSGGKYDPDILNFDKENLRKFYANEGFVDADISLAKGELNLERELFFITFVISEGERYKFGNIGATIKTKGVNKETIKNAIKISKGDWFSAQRLDDTVIKITEDIMTEGQPFISVIPRLERTEENIVNVNFEISPAPKKYINRIIVSGNTRTLDKVIRRKLRFAEGDAFNRGLIRRSKTLVTNLGHFASVNIIDKESDEEFNAVDLEIQVQEQSTGSFSIGGGFSSANGAQAQIGLSENNLMGKSQRLKFELLTSERENRADFSFTETFFLGRDIAFTSDIYTTVQEFLESKYDNEKDGFGTSISYNNGEYGRQTIGYRLEKRNIIAYTGASSSVISESGRTILSIINLGNTYDKTDNRIDPTDGWFVSNNIGLAGVGGDKQYLKITAKAANFKKLYQEKYIFSLSGNIGYVLGLNQDIEISDRFFIGNNSFVGFQNAGIGPRDKNTDDSLGGNFYYTTTPELKFGLGLPKELGIKARVFSTIGTLSTIDTDISNYYDNYSLRVTAGTGVLWQSPFGPIRLDYSYALLKEDYDKTETFSFNVGSLF
ncbi:MAG: outer membrane protein assembly factor BamA [Rickettsiales bacterium]|nr:outer membrane protein assembly factor BamA [Rickettsiales bacterium]